MDGILREFERLEKKQINKPLISSVDRITQLLEDTKRKIQNDPSNTASQMALLKAKYSGETSKILEYQKDSHKAIASCTKALQNKFKSDPSTVISEDVFDGKEKEVNTTIAMHLIRQGQFELADTFIRESGLEIPPTLQSEFREMYDILQAIRARNLGPAIEWADKKRILLEQLSSDLSFDLHRLQFIQLFNSDKEDPAPQALAYAQANFLSFQQRHLAEIARLMNALCWVNNTSSSPYQEAFSTDSPLWTHVEDNFREQFCSLLGFSPHSPLQIAVTAGTIALPVLLKMSSIMREKRTEWTSEGELPVEIPLPDSFHFHSIFTCPVSKEQSTEDNPPMLLTCGHCLCKNSLMRLAKADGQKIKCPYDPRIGGKVNCRYCPVTFYAKDAMQVIF